MNPIDQDPGPGKPRVQFQKHISLGNVLQIVSMVATVAGTILWASSAYFDFKSDVLMRMTKQEGITDKLTTLVDNQQTQINVIFDRLLPGDRAERRE